MVCFLWIFMPGCGARRSTVEQRRAVKEPFDAPFGGLLEFGGVDRDRCDMFITGHDRIQLFEVVLHDLRKVVLVDPFALGLLVVGHDQCVEFAVVLQHERFQHEVHDRFP